MLFVVGGVSSRRRRERLTISGKKLDQNHLVVLAIVVGRAKVASHTREEI